MLVAGQLLYWGSLVLLGLLAKRLQAHYRTFPMFVTYVWFCLFRSVLLFALTYQPDFYQKGYWTLRYVSTFLLFCVLGELVRHSCGKVAWERAGQLAGVVPVWLLIGNYSLELDRGISIALALALASLAFGHLDKQSVAIVAGLFVIKFLDAATLYSPSFARGAWLQFVPTVAFNVAILGCWLPAFPANRSKQCL